MTFPAPVINGATATGEIVSVTSDTITIKGTFYPGLVIPLHVGARVAVLNEDDANRIFK